MAIDLVAVLRLDDQMTKSLKSATAAATIGFAAIGAAAIGAVDKFTKVEAELRRTAALTGATEAQFSQLESAAIAMSSSSSKGMAEIATSMATLGANGMETNEIIAAMPGIISASTASGESLALAADVVSSSLNAWGLEASEAGKVADVLSTSANISAAGLYDLGMALKYVGAPAAILEMDLASVTAAIATMVDVGIDGSSAGTSLRAALLALNSPAAGQAKLMKQLGFSLTDASGQAKSLVDIIGNLDDATRNMTSANKLATISTLVGTDAASGFLALMAKGPAELQKMTDALRDSEGAAAATAAEMSKSLAAALGALMSLIEATAYQVGDGLAPAVSRVVKALQKIDVTALVNAVATLGNTFVVVFDKIESNWSKIAPILKPILVGVAAFGAAIMAVGGVSAVFLAISAAVGFISSPLALVAVGIGVVAGAFTALYAHVAPFRDFFVTLKQSLTGGLFTGILDRDQGAVTAALEMANKIKAAFASIKEYIAQKVVELQPAIAMFSAAFVNVKEIAINMATGLWGVVGPIFSLLGNALSILGDVVVIVFNNIIAPAFLMMTEGVSVMWKVISPILGTLGSALEVVGEAVLLLWKVAFAPFIDYLTSGMVLMADIVMPILEGIGGVFDVIASAISYAIGYVKEFASYLANIEIPDWVSGLGSAAINVVSKVLPGDASPGGAGRNHYHGLSNVPYNGYEARLHKSERILTAQENKEYTAAKEGRGSSGGVTIAKLADSIYVREEADIDRIATALANRIESKIAIGV